MNDPAMNFLAPNSPGFQRLPPTVQQLLLIAGSNRIYAHEPVPSGKPATQLLTNNLCEYTYPDTLPFEEKAICWYRNLLLHPDRADDMTGFDNGDLNCVWNVPSLYFTGILSDGSGTSTDPLYARDSSGNLGNGHT